jgi:hypothetical protein
MWQPLIKSIAARSVIPPPRISFQFVFMLDLMLFMTKTMFLVSRLSLLLVLTAATSALYVPNKPYTYKINPPSFTDCAISSTEQVGGSYGLWLEQIVYLSLNGARPGDRRDDPLDKQNPLRKAFTKVDGASLSNYGCTLKQPVERTTHSHQFLPAIANISLKLDSGTRFTMKFSQQVLAPSSGVVFPVEVASFTIDGPHEERDLSAALSFKNGENRFLPCGNYTDTNTFEWKLENIAGDSDAQAWVTGTRLGSGQTDFQWPKWPGLDEVCRNDWPKCDIGKTDTCIIGSQSGNGV